MTRPRKRTSGFPAGAGWLAAAAASSLVAAAIVQNRSRAAKRDNPPTGRFVDVDGVRLHYFERGRGQPLVLLHGNTTMALDFMMSGLVEMAAERYRVIVFDRPGYGYSDRPRGRTVWGPVAQARLINDALAKTGVRRPLVLGHSWGAMVAAAMEMEDPGSVAGLVLESGYFYPTPRPEAVLSSLPAAPVLGDFMRLTFAPLLYRAMWPMMVKQMFAPARVPEHFWDFPPWMAFRPSQLRASAAEMGEVVPAAIRLSRRYRELSRVPVAVVAGREDRLVGQDAQSDRLHRELPEAYYLVVPGMGHMLHHLVPGEVMAAIDLVAEPQDR